MIEKYDFLFECGFIQNCRRNRILLHILVTVKKFFFSFEKFFGWQIAP